MDLPIGLQEVANVVAFVAPGYFAVRAYSLVFAKSDKEFSRLLIESVVFSVPILALFHLLWSADTISAPYVLALLCFSVVVGLVVARVRATILVRGLAARLRLPAADEDFIRVQFQKLKPTEPVTVALQNGDVFSGTPQGGSAYAAGQQPRHYYFNNIEWYDPKRNRWEAAEGSLIIDLSEVEYMMTSRALPRD